jgi:hypothetical protein
MIHTGSSDAMIKFAVTAAASVNPHWRSQCEANLGQGLVPAAGAVPGEDVEYQCATATLRGHHRGRAWIAGPPAAGRAFLGKAAWRLAALESTDTPAGPLVISASLAEWASYEDALAGTGS